MLAEPFRVCKIVEHYAHPHLLNAKVIAELSTYSDWWALLADRMCIAIRTHGVLYVYRSHAGFTVSACAL